MNSESKDEEIPPLEDARDVDHEKCTITSESFMVRRALNAHINEDDMDLHRSSIFHTRCQVNDKICNLIIDGRSCINIASTCTTLVEKLGLPTIQHPTSYRLYFLNDKGKVKVNNQVLVSFT